MKRLLLALGLVLFAGPALAQGCGPTNPNCVVADRPAGDSTNAAANTRFVGSALSPFFITCPTHQFVTSILAGLSTCAQPAFSDLTGSVAAGQMPALTGDVTSSAGTVATTITTNIVTNAKAAQMAANTVKANPTSATANASDMAMPSCSTATSALQWTTNTGIGCGTISSTTDATLFANFIGGCTLSATGANTTISNTACTTNADDNSTLMKAAAFTKTTAAWAVGSGNGCLDTGSVATNTWYAIFQIERTDTQVVDYVCTVETAGVTPSPTMPTNYTKKRYIGSFLTDATPNIRKFQQAVDMFMYDAPFQTDINQSNPGTSAVSVTLTTPRGIVVEAINTLYCSNNTTNPQILVSSLGVADTAPGTTLQSVECVLAATTHSQNVVRTLTNTSAQIRIRWSSSGAADTLVGSTIGYRDLARYGN